MIYTDWMNEEFWKCLEMFHRGSQASEQQIKGMKVLNALPGRMPFLSLGFFRGGEASLSIKLVLSVEKRRKLCLWCWLLPPTTDRFPSYSRCQHNTYTSPFYLGFTKGCFSYCTWNNCLWILGSLSLRASRNTFVETAINAYWFLKKSS